MAGPNMGDAPRRILTPMRLTRRQALQLGIVGGAGGLLFLSGCSRTALGQDDDPFVSEDPPLGGELTNPPEVTAQNGVLTAALTAAAGTATINGNQTTSTSLYNGNYPSETWRLQPGDVFRVSLTNQLDTFTNLHWHGMHVSPQGNADNIFLSIEPGQTFDYEVPVPADHVAGAYWYHPHFHTTVDAQVYGGMGGLILLDGGWLELPGVAAATEKLLVLKEVVVEDEAVGSSRQARRADAEVAESPGVTANELWTVNGQVNPQISAAPGERQLWRVANLGNDSFFRIALEDHDLHIVAADGVPLRSLLTMSEWTLPPASRVEFLVEPSTTGSFRLRQLGINEGFESFAPRTLATMVVDGAQVNGLPELPDVIDDSPEDFRDSDPDVVRQLVFNNDLLLTGDGDVASTGNWLICDLTFDPARTDISAKLGALEEWKIFNVDTEDHPFHIHQNDFQVVAINGVAEDFTGYRDTVSIPRGGSITIRQRYLDFTGKWVFHCHILFHEDHGMMGVIEVT